MRGSVGHASCFEGRGGRISAWNRRRGPARSRRAQKPVLADDSATSGRDIPAPRTRANRGSRRTKNARGSSVRPFEHAPGLSSFCTRPCQPSRGAGVRRRSGGREFTNCNAMQCKVGTTNSCRERDERSVRRAGWALDNRRGCARCRSDEIKILAGSRSVLCDATARTRLQEVPSTRRNFRSCEKFLGRRELGPRHFPNSRQISIRRLIWRFSGSAKREKAL